MDQAYQGAPQSLKRFTSSESPRRGIAPVKQAEELRIHMETHVISK
jgi:hypothetical protein